MDETSLEIVDVTEMYPKQSFTSDDGESTVPFTLLSGEGPLFRGNTAEGIFIVTSYRLYHTEGPYINIPLGLIDCIECKEIFYLLVNCKDGRSYRCTFESAEDVQKWFKRVQSCIKLPEKIDHTFAFRFYSWSKEEKNEGIVSQTHCDINLLSDSTDYQFDQALSEAERMGFDMKSVWKISKVNKDQKLCPSYPQYLIFPFSVCDADILDLANFRYTSRIPAVVWRHQQNGAVIARSSQPRLGFFSWRNTSDENLIGAISLACLVDPGYENRTLNSSSDSDNFIKNNVEEDISIVCANPNVKKSVAKKLLIVDARSYAAAMTNRAKGGGYECEEYYLNTEIQFMGLANIHTIRNSFASLRTLCANPDDQNWLSALENTKWLHHISGIIRAALLVANAVDVEERPVLVHCSDGWDRTPQIVALAEIILDPYYRTKKGFQVLVEREWLEFGHKFADRCGHSDGTEDRNERCPVFLQWLDCVFQLLCQFRCHFEFNEQYLARLVLHTYSCLFGTFLCNTDECRSRYSLPRRTFSVWPVLNEKSQFTNYLYNHSTEVLRPSCQIRSLEFWGDVYLPNNSANLGRSTVPPIEEPLLPESDEKTSNLVKTKSCENLHKHSKSLQRRLSDTNLVENSCGIYPQISELTNKTLLSVPNQTIAVSANVCKTNGECNKTSERTDIALVHNSNLSLREPTIDGSTDTLVSEMGAIILETEKSDLKSSNTRNVHTVGTDTNDLPLENFNYMDGLPNWCQNAIGAYICSKRNDASNSCTCSYTTPNHSRTPSSGFPATPCDDSREMPTLKRDSATCQIMDFDGLNIVPDYVQQRIKKLILHYKNKVNCLQMELSSTRAEVFCRNYQGKPCLDGEDSPSLPDSNASGEHPADSAGSESSWDLLFPPENATSHHEM